VNTWEALGVVWILAVAMMVAGWAWQRRHSNAGIVDVLWAAGLGGSAVLLGAIGDGAAPPRLLLGLLGGLWGLRLALHLWNRMRSGAEDGRYRYLRLLWRGSQFKFFLFFQFQALLVALFALPFLAVSGNPLSAPPWLALAGAIWIVSLLGEAIADAQLARFRAAPGNHGRTCCHGLWRYSRHPNYFFEWLHWFSYVALAVGAPRSWLAWSGPLVMFVFLRWLSGVPFTEAQALRTRGDDYRDYQRRTPVLFPWFPKESG
jgi:steroid 5-alpha reductase family enzyme